jgi:hypothetical protein
LTKVYKLERLSCKTKRFTLHTIIDRHGQNALFHPKAYLYGAGREIR